jgi:general secretion pathway protein F
MPIFHYKAVATDGQSLQGEIEALSKADAISRLQDAGHLPISAEEVSSKRQFSFSFVRNLFDREKVSQHDVVILTRELATLTEAGLPLDHALKTLAGLDMSAPVQDLLQSILKKIEGGASLSDAMTDHGDVFSRLYLNMIRAGEASGAMDVVIERLANYMERMSDLRSSVITALIYPIILLVVSLLSLLVLMTFVVPQFVPLFEDVGQALPLLTQIVFSISEVFRQFWWLGLVLFTLTVWLGDKQLKEADKRLAFDGWCLRLPIIGELLKQMEMARFARTLGTTMANGVPLLTGIRLVREVIGNRVIAKVMDSVTASLEQGQTMTLPLKESKVCPALATQLIEVGEESGQLEAMLIKIADIYDREVQTSIKRMLTFFEPVLILGLGGLIAVIITSILLAILGLNDLVI